MRSECGRSGEVPFLRVELIKGVGYDQYPALLQSISLESALITLHLVPVSFKEPGERQIPAVFRVEVIVTLIKYTTGPLPEMYAGFLIAGL